MGLFIGVLILLVVFLVIREFWTWYWKQNEVVRQLQAMNDKLEYLARQQGYMTRADHEAVATRQRKVQHAPPPPPR